MPAAVQAATVCSSSPHKLGGARLECCTPTLKPHWLTAGFTVTFGKSCESADALKLLTPIARAVPAATSGSSARYERTLASMVSQGQCRSSRSTYSRPSALKVSSTSFVTLCSVRHSGKTGGSYLVQKIADGQQGTLVVTKTSLRCSPDSRTARPTSTWSL